MSGKALSHQPGHYPLHCIGWHLCGPSWQGPPTIHKPWSAPPYVKIKSDSLEYFQVGTYQQKWSGHRGKYRQDCRSLPQHSLILLSKQDFYYKLASHLISELLFDGLTIKPADYTQFMVFNNIMYVHKALQINFTTYDNQHDQDTINPCTHSDVIMLSDSNSRHPYCYAHVLGIYHASIWLNSA